MGRPAKDFLYYVLTAADFPALGECEFWIGGLDSWSYGITRRGDKVWKATRRRWVMEFDGIPVGKYVLHTCHNPPCVAVIHLYLGTLKDNAADRDKAGHNYFLQKTHCVWGHRFTESNTYRWTRPSGAVMRACRTCKMARKRAHLQNSRRSH